MAVSGNPGLGVGFPVRSRGPRDRWCVRSPMSDAGECLFLPKIRVFRAFRPPVRIRTRARKVLERGARGQGRFPDRFRKLATTRPNPIRTETRIEMRMLRTTLSRLARSVARLAMSVRYSACRVFMRSSRTATRPGGSLCVTVPDGTCRPVRDRPRAGRGRAVRRGIRALGQEAAFPKRFSAEDETEDGDGQA